MSLMSANRRARLDGSDGPRLGGVSPVWLHVYRHGTSEWNLLHKWQGEQDTELAPEVSTTPDCLPASLSLRGVGAATAASAVGGPQWGEGRG